MNFEVLSLPDFLAQEHPPLRMLCEPYIEEGALTFAFGAPGSLKSWFAIDVALRTAEAGHNVLWIAEEGRPQKLQERFRKLGGGNANLHCMGRQGFRVDEPDHTPWLLEEIEKQRFKLVIIDPLADTWVVDDSDQLKVLAVRNTLKTITATGTALLIVHHSTKTGWGSPGKKARPSLANLRGSGVLAGSAELVLELVAERTQSGLTSAHLHVLKAKDLELTSDQRTRLMSLVETGNGLRIDWCSEARSSEGGNGTTADGRKDLRSRILAEVRKRPGQSKNRIAEALGGKRERVFKVINELVHEGWMRCEEGSKGSNLLYASDEEPANCAQEGVS
jgi:hypothetical protein